MVSVDVMAVIVSLDGQAMIAQFENLSVQTIAQVMVAVEKMEAVIVTLDG